MLNKKRLKLINKSINDHTFDALEMSAEFAISFCENLYVFSNPSASKKLRNIKIVSNDTSKNE